MRAFDRDLIGGGHYGQRSCEPHPKGRTHGCTDQCCKREESSCQLGAVHTWHFASVHCHELRAHVAYGLRWAKRPQGWTAREGRCSPEAAVDSPSIDAVAV